MAESELWKQMKKSPPAGVELMRVECLQPPGFSDVYWCGGNMEHRSGHVELKDEETHVRPQQGIFLRKIGAAGMSAWVLARKKIGGRSLVFLIHGSLIPFDNTIPYDRAIDHWQDEVYWPRFWDYVGSNTQHRLAGVTRFRG